MLTHYQMDSRIDVIDNTHFFGKIPFGCPSYLKKKLIQILKILSSLELISAYKSATWKKKVWMRLKTEYSETLPGENKKQSLKDLKIECAELA